MSEPSTPLEIWGGVERSVTRVGDRYSDRLRLSGHDRRIADLDVLARLGINAIRYRVNHLLAAPWLTEQDEEAA